MRGEMPISPRSRRESVPRVTPKRRAHSEIDQPTASRSACGGFAGMGRIEHGHPVSLLVVVDKVHVHGFTVSGESEDDAPIGGDPYAPEAGELPLQRMQSVAGSIQIARCSRCIEDGEDAYPFDLFRVQSPRVRWRASAQPW